MEQQRMNPTHRRRAGGFTLIEAMVTLAILAIVAAIAMPSYTRHVVRASRQDAQAQLSELAALQEKIYLNSSLYTASVTAAYNGRSDGGLGVTSGKTQDGMYTISITPTTPGQTYTLTAAPVAGKRQASDGTITLSSTGVRLWGSHSW
jgi:type IV pilus assembly protein PilE